MIEILIMRSNSVIYDPRVRKIVSSLSKRYSTAVLGWNREGVLKKEIDKYIVELRLFGLKAPFGKLYLALYFPLFWFWILIKLFVYKPKIVHACDLDTVLPCYIYTKIFRKRLIFDVFDRYAMSYIPPTYRVLYCMVNMFEELMSGKADVLVTVSEKMQRTFRRKPKHSTIIMNCPEDHFIENVQQEINHNTEFLRLFYSGNIGRNHGLEVITSAIKDLPRVELIIAGRVIERQLLSEILQVPNVKYKGILLPADHLTLQACSDVIVGLYNLENPNYAVMLPNKLFDAMMFGKPIITNVGPEVVHEFNCGIVVDYNDINTIKAEVISLRDNVTLRRQLGNNGRKAFLQKYNWGRMEKELYKIYDNLLLND
jgi:glycosyltransferase involved in cell wall biosynthesis